MKKIVFSLITILSVCFFASCRDRQTYADQKEAERSAINKFIADSAVKVISETTFASQDYTTNVAQNEYVLLSSSGVYMQIRRKGTGEKIKNGETANVLCRFTERNLMTDSVQLSNQGPYYSAIVDKMMVRNTSGTFTASFVKGESLMAFAYRSTEVPSGLLVPFSYIRLGRPAHEGDEIARVRLIVPHSSNHSYARQSVYPCLYDITYQRGK
ncbi:DUF4827 domain-containing protein [Hoylesella timonensis]|uniref:DUF4827 domain-containing protein n=1 Tax=Hoylesella timonensis TaxID=386414 RepID=UPI0018994F82|nr:DUF4827 domain-containing protein [Hoylesella timonensis]